MKEKFILKNGEKIMMGDVICRIGEVDLPLGEGIVMQKIKVNEETLPELLDRGILKRETSPEEPKIPMDMNFYIKKIAEGSDVEVKEVMRLLQDINYIYPAAALSTILREIAIELDKKYEDHIENSPEIYVVSMFDGRITKANKAHIKNYRNFAAFRSIEDARIACKIVKPLLKEMFRVK